MHEETEVLAGGGEMGALMRAIDWSKLPVGPPEGWPASLRTVLGILLASEHPFFVWWGPDLIQFYNDGYRPILGSTKHPAAMGQAGRDCWTEIWDVIAPMIAKVFAGGSTHLKDGMLVLDRHGFLEECYFNYGYSPIRDDAGAIAGVFVAANETTGQVIGERRLALGRELFTRAGLDTDVNGVFRSVETVLAHATLDLPIALVYEVAGDVATLVSCVGLRRGERAAPTEVRLDDASLWPIGSVSRSGAEEMVEHLGERFGVLTAGAWPEPVTKALVLPISKGADGVTTSILVAGLSPRLPFSDEYRNFIQLLARQIGTSITTTQMLTQEKRRAADLAELDRAKTAFFSNVSHEFRTPLTLILALLDDALRDLAGPLPPEQRARLELAQRNSIRLLKLVNTLLDFSRIEAGRAKARHELTDLGALTTDLVSVFRSLVESAGLTLTFASSLSEAVYVDREMYEKIVLNILSNAFKFTFEGGIRVSLDVEEEHVRLLVSDTGVGIPAIELPRLFERFHRVEGARGRSYEGSGIGLALVQELAKLHGGSISVTSVVGKGTCFGLSLPRGSTHLTPERRAATAEPATARVDVTGYLDEASSWVRNALVVPPPGPLAAPSDGVPLHGPDRILLADDNADMRAYIGRLLTDHGWQVDPVADGVAARERAFAHVPDLVLADVMMPGLNGFELLEALKADERTSGVPVVLLSARAGEEAVMEGMRAGADDYLVKPFTAKELISRVAARLEMSRARREVLASETAIRTGAVRERQKLQDLFMQVPIAIAVLEAPGHTYTFANPAYVSLVGGRDVIGKPLLEALPEIRDQGFDTLLDRVVETRQPFIGTEVLANLDRTGTGRVEEVYYNLVYSPSLDARGQVEGVFVCAVDVTEQVLARRRVESVLEALRNDEQRKDEFLAMLAHELRNPMAAIDMALSMLECVRGDFAREVEYHNLARRQMVHLVRLVDDLLDVSRITRGTFELRTAEIDLAQVVRDAASATRALVEAGRHTLSITVATGPFPMIGDATRLEQVLVNLIGNAVKFTAPGGVISVGLAREVVSGTVHAVVRVCDNGRGIPLDMLEKVFDLFVQVRPTLDRSAGGLGLGLTLVKRLAGMHGGTVSAHTGSGGNGSEFVVRLPLAPDPPAGWPHEFAPSRTAGEQRRRILIVEDSADIGSCLVMFLEMHGHEVTLATDGIEGAALALALGPDVALVDIGLPGIDGYEVARRVRAQPRGDAIYLVAVTGYGGVAARAKAEAAGFDLHITKPVDMRALPEVVSRARTSRNGLGVGADDPVRAGSAPGAGSRSTALVPGA